MIRRLPIGGKQMIEAILPRSNCVSPISCLSELSPSHLLRIRALSLLPETEFSFQSITITCKIMRSEDLNTEILCSRHTSGLIPLSVLSSSIACTFLPF